MEREGGHITRFMLLFLLVFLTAGASGCASNQGVPQWSGSGFLRKQFLDYRSFATLPFEGDDSGEVTAAFAESLSERFPQVSIVRLLSTSDLLKGEVVRPNQLDEATRLKIGRALNAGGLVVGSVYYPSITTWYLQVEIVDTESGKVLGRSMVEINYMGAEGFRQGARLAVEKLTLY